MGLFELVSEIGRLTKDAELGVFFDKLLQEYGLKSLAYLGSGLLAGPEQNPYLAVTYTSDWVEHYKAQRFVKVDPAVQVGLRRMVPVDWDEFDKTSTDVQRLFGEAREFGLGRRGISLPIHGRGGDRALVSITSDAKDREWQTLRLEYMRDFQILALHLHQAILRMEGISGVDRRALSPRERECLQWTAEGKTCWECAVILGLSERTVRFYLETARHKLGAANTTHAIMIAGKASLLSDLP